MTSTLVTLENYQIIEQIYEGSRTLVYRGRNMGNDQPVVIKLMQNEYPSFRELGQFRNQYAIALKLDIPGIVKPLALENYRNGYALVMPDEGYVSLQSLITRPQSAQTAAPKSQLAAPGKEAIAELRQCNIADFLNIAIQLTQILHQLYQNRVIHKDIKPANILIHPETQQVKLIDFSISSLLPKETQEIQNPNVLEGTLAYISPEQTGRMNRGIDYRTDFYSLGVSFYELLTGELPFQSDDPMELVHCHIAKYPTFKTGRNRVTGGLGEIPQIVLDMVIKLMAKNAEDRYQSALGLKYDLEKCWQQWQNTGKIEPFALGTRDICDRFTIPEKLYGREAEVAQLLAAFDRVANPPESPQGVGNTEMILVAGFSGIGKTAVVNEVHKPIVRQRGYFIKGKFDQFQRNIPFSAFVQAFRSLMGQLLSESNAQIQQWKDKILAALGEDAQAIVDVIPELENIVGKQPSIPEISGIAAQNRFNLLFGKFIRVFTVKEHPLVIFLDDLQWADSASLNLLQLLMKETATGYLLVLGAYRDNEVYPTHPLMLTLDKIKKQCNPADVSAAKERTPREERAIVNTITLTSLSQSSLNDLIADTLSCSLELAVPLTELVYQKTQGNPFFATQFLKALHEGGLISFDSELRYWQCDMAQVRQLTLTDDVVEFMASRLQKLPDETQTVLRRAACIGNSFDLGTLAVVCDRSEAEVAAGLWRGLQDGFVLPQSDTYKFYQLGESDRPLPLSEALERAQRDRQSFSYKFLHDRIQQAAYSLITEPQKEKIHYQIGRRILASTSPHEREEKIFEIVNQINIGRHLIKDESEAHQLAELNLIAGQKAKLSTAYQAASNYLQIGIKLLTKKGWQDAYNITYNLYLCLAEAQLMNTDFEPLNQTVSTLLEFAESKAEIANIYAIKINQYTIQSQFKQAIEIGLEGLAKIGLSFNRETIQEAIAEEFVALENKIEEKIAEGDISLLLDLPAVTDRDICSIIKLLEKLDAPAYFSGDFDLYSFVSLRGARLSVEHGNIGESIKFYSNYGFILSLRNQRKKGFEVSIFSIQLSHKLNSKSQQCKAACATGGWIQVWAKSIRGAAEINYNGFVAGMDSGEIQFAGYNLFAHICNRIFQGENIANIAVDIEKYLRLAEKINHDLLGSILGACQFFTDKLTASDEERDRLESEERAWVERHETAGAYMPLGIYSILQMHATYLTQNGDRSLHHATEAGKFISACAGFTTSSDYYYYSSLIWLNSYSSLAKVEQKEAIARIEANQNQLKSWSESCPENFEHKYLLVEAQRARVEGKKLEAMELYDRAIALAKKNEYLPEVALANELAAEFYRDWGKEKIATVYLTEAYYNYARWGAKTKIEDLEQRHPDLLANLRDRNVPPPTIQTTPTFKSTETFTHTNINCNSRLDLSTALKAARAISGEIQLDRLLSTLMRVILENAGAQQGSFLLMDGESLTVAVQATCHDPQEELQIIKDTSIAIEDCPDLPRQLVQYVARTQQPLVLAGIEAEKQFVGEPYFSKHKPQSLLCSPIFDRDRCLGILYLENTATARAFNSDRLELLELLSAQAAISLENARLYSRLENYSHTLEVKVQERTEQLQDKNQSLQQTLQNLQRTQTRLIQAEKMSALGQMVAGIAHEINNPINFIAGNVSHAREYFHELIDLINGYDRECPNPSTTLQQQIEDIDLDFLKEDLDKLLVSMESGSDRIRKIILSLRNFSRLDEAERKQADIHEGLENALGILQYRLKLQDRSSEIAIIKNYGKLPPIHCSPRELNQVFLNILTNAIDALKAYNAATSPKISIVTETRNSQTVRVTIADNGPGMSPSIRQKVFDPFFTTKPVGQGTGLGLSIAHQIITEGHKGQLQCISHPGKGTKFVIDIPI